MVGSTTLYGMGFAQVCFSCTTFLGMDASRSAASMLCLWQDVYTCVLLSDSVTVLFVYAGYQLLRLSAQVIL